MALNLDLIGRKGRPITYEYTWKDCVLYALGAGAKHPQELDYLFEGRGPKILPTFSVVPAFPALMDVFVKLGADLRHILHGEQELTQHRSFPAGGKVVTTAEVRAIYDKGKSAVVEVLARTTDTDGEPLADNVFTLFVRGAGGFGGDRGPQAPAVTIPGERAPDFRTSQTTTTEQGALYRLSGDLNPLHISPSMADKAGFDRPILHGLCTFAIAARAVLAHLCDGDPTRLGALSARFAGVVFPGDTLTVAGWRTGDDTCTLQVTRDDGTPVLTNAVATVQPNL